MAYSKHDFQDGQVLTGAAMDDIDSAIEVLDAGMTAAQEDIAELQEGIATKAEIDGYYETLTAGNAEQLLATTGAEDRAPYLQRQTGGGVNVGDRAVEKIVGGTIAWNQLNANDGSTATVKGVTYTKGDNGVWAITGTATGSDRKTISAVSVSQNHVFAIFPGASDSALYGTSGANVAAGKIALVILHGSDSSSQSFIGFGGAIIKKSSYTMTSLRAAQSATFVSGETGLTICPQLFDLTQMFGSAVADAVYAMEQATTGTGVAWFRAMFPESYYSYNAGELKSVQTSGKRVTGFNLFEGNSTESSQYIGHYYVESATNSYARTANNNFNCFRVPVIPGETYFIRTKSGNLGSRCNQRYVDSSYALISGGGDYAANSTKPSMYFTPPDGCAYVEFSIPIVSDVDSVCINVSGAHDGEYKAYHAPYQYPLDSSLILRGIPKWDSVKGTMYYDGDEYTSDGRVKWRYGIVDLGTLNWQRDTVNGRYWTTGALPNAKGGYNGFVQSPYYYNLTDCANNYASASVDLALGVYVANKKIVLINRTEYSAGTTGAELKPKLSGIMLVYELATPAIDPATPYTGAQWAEAGGTEAFIDAGTETGRVAVPVGHETFYPTDLRGGLETLLSPEVTVTGTTATINAERDRRYLCGTVTELTFTPCATGLCEVRFTSGTTPTVLTLPQTVKMPDWWNGVEASTTYEISIADGIYGAVMAWPT